MAKIVVYYKSLKPAFDMTLAEHIFESPWGDINWFMIKAQEGNPFPIPGTAHPCLLAVHKRHVVETMEKSKLVMIIEAGKPYQVVVFDKKELPRLRKILKSYQGEEDVLIEVWG